MRPHQRHSYSLQGKGTAWDLWNFLCPSTAHGAEALLHAALSAQWAEPQQGHHDLQTSRLEQILLSLVTRTRQKMGWGAPQPLCRYPETEQWLP